MADALKNFSYSTVATAPSPAASGTSLVVAAGEGTKFAVGRPATIWPAGAQPSTSNEEIVLVTAIATDTLTITRAQEGSAARTVVVGDQIAQTMTAALAMRNVYIHPPATSSTSDSISSAVSAVPGDNTIPQITEGKEYLTWTGTPLNASSALLVEFKAFVAGSTASTVTVFLCQDAIANGLHAEATINHAATYSYQMHLKHYISSAGSGSRTYRIRFGTNAGTAYMLRRSDTDLYSTAKQATLTVTEILP